jgi:hypothetical protein
MGDLPTSHVVNVPMDERANGPHVAKPVLPAVLP